MIVYVISGGGYSKIGITKNVKTRLGQLQHANPVTLRIMKTIELPDDMAPVVEGMAHAFLRERKIKCRGEWFKVPWEIAGRAVTDAARLQQAVTNVGTGVSGLTFDEVQIEYDNLMNNHKNWRRGWDSNPRYGVNRITV